MDQSNNTVEKDQKRTAHHNQGPLTKISYKKVFIWYQRTSLYLFFTYCMINFELQIQNVKYFEILSKCNVIIANKNQT